MNTYRAHETRSLRYTIIIVHLFAARRESPKFRHQGFRQPYGKTLSEWH